MQYRLFGSYNCKLFGLREHRSLVREQFEVNSDQQGRFYDSEDATRRMCMAALNSERCSLKIKIYACPDLGEKCVVDVDFGERDV